MLLKEVKKILKDAVTRLDDKYERVQKGEYFITFDYGHDLRNHKQMSMVGIRRSIMSGSFKVVCTIDITNDEIVSAAYDEKNCRLFDIVLDDKTWPIWHTTNKKDKNWDTDNLILLLTPGV